jgi:acyl-CoA synthetase (AMP-forming)/AMP-acid ligase II
MEPLSSPLADPLLALVRDRARDFATNPYLLDARSSRVLRFDQLAESVDFHRRQLHSWGLKAGERFGLVVGDPLEFASWFIAGIALGAWVAPLDPTPASLGASSARAKTLGATFVVSDRGQPEGAITDWILATTPPVGGETSYDQGEELIRGGLVLSSSGTTGAPKVMALGTEQLLATATLIAEHHRLVESDRGFNPLPLWHVNAEVVGLLATLVAGSSLVLDERFHRTDFWSLVNSYNVTWINAVPAIISRLASLNAGETPSRRIRFVRSASAPLAPELFERFEAEIGIPIIQSYGMTEAASQICVSPIDGVRKAGSVGVAAGVEVRVRADVFEVGPIEIKGPTVIRRYESPGYEARFDAEGWLRTGDLGYFDHDHYLFIVGRDDDVINRGGEKIYPLEIEGVIASVEGVGAVAVIGRADDVFGQVPIAFITPSDHAALTSPEELAAIVARVRKVTGESLPSTHRPVAVQVVAELPQHATGKIQKAGLRQGDVAVIYEARL